MAPRLDKFLFDYKSTTTFHTHVSLSKPIGKFTINSKLPEFWKIYTETIKHTAPSIAESPCDEMPVVVDIDLSDKYLEGEPRQLYTQKDVELIVKTFQTAIKEIITKCNTSHLSCVLLEKSPYVEETGSGFKLLKNGFHLHFPKMFIDRQVQKVYLFPIVEKLLTGTSMAGHVDENSVNVHWLLYGSCKPGKFPYLVTKCFNHLGKETDFVETFKDHRICFPNLCDTFEDKIPQIFSIILGDRKEYYHSPKTSIVTPLLDKFTFIRTSRKPFVQTSIEESMMEAEQLVGMIDPKRSDNRTDWLTVGFCLHNISEGDDEGLTCWLSFSEQSDKYSEVECLSLWENMRENRYTIGTLKHFAKLDNPEKYSAWLRTKSEGLLDKIIKTSHHDVASLMFTEYGSEFVCASISDKTWFQFIDHTWKQVDRGTTLRKRISADNGVLMQLLLKKLFSAQEEDNPDLVKDIEKVIRGLKSSPTKNNIMVECAEVFYNKDFYAMLNSDPYLFAFKNGIYDFTQNTFRPGKPEDYISKQVAVDYLDFKSFNHPQIIKVDDYFRQIFPNQGIRNYFLWQTSKVFIGGNIDKICLFWTGTGNNGKTITQSLFEKLLGPYAVKLNTNVITGKKIQNGSANPEMARLGDGCRWAVMEEPNSDETINTGIFKNLTGNDSFFARDLYCSGKNTREIKPFFKLHFICNKLPELSNADIATWNRIRVIPFETTFTNINKCPQTRAEQEEQKIFPADLHLEEKIPDMLPGLAWYLIEIWKRNKFYDEPSPPPEVMQATANYKDETNIYKQFIQDMVIDKQNSTMSLSQVVSVFREWKKMEYPNTIINPRHIKQEFILLLGEPSDTKHWKNKCIKDMTIAD
uniref:D5 Family NTPase involved in DNA replication n=1 Tax=Rhinella marina erythrocytic-like virus TaxID=2859906 RepID=A0A8F6UAC4_9VIRU|nr:D5 Family NTPase involved in DNA replication [Rhinella marina erythrocytic-like virus]